DIGARSHHVRFTPKSGHPIRTAEMLEWFLARGRVCSPSHLTTTAEVLLRADYASAVDGGGDGFCQKTGGPPLYTQTAQQGQLVCCSCDLPAANPNKGAR